MTAADSISKTRRVLRWALPFIPAILAMGVLLLCKVSPWYAEFVHARGVYPVLTTVLTFLTSSVSFSFTELLAVFSLPLLVLVIWLARRVISRSASPRVMAGRLARGVLWVLSAVFLLYILMHGANYYRYPMYAWYGLDMSPKDIDFLQYVVEDLAVKASETRELVTEDGDGVMKLREGAEACLRSADEALAPRRASDPLLRGTGTQPKGVLVSELWSYTGITGFYSMPLCEANVNIAQSAFGIPFSVAHELSHTCGIAREDEANFAAYLLCRESNDPDYRYAAYATAFIYCSNALYDNDRERWREAHRYLSEDVLRDFSAQSEYWQAHKGVVEEVSTSINDGFLKAQGQEDGVLSYNRVVALILADYAARAAAE